MKGEQTFQQDFFQQGQLVQSAPFSLMKYLFETLVNHAPCFYCIMNTNEEVLFANTSLLSYLNIRSEDLPKPARDLLPGPLYHMFQLHFDSANKASISQSTNVRTFSIDGRERFFQVHYLPLEPIERPTLFAGIAYDVSHQEYLEKALIACNEKWMAFTHRGFMGAWELDISSGKVYCNNTLKKILGFDADNACTVKNFFRSIVPEQRRRVKSSLKAFLKGKKESWEEQYTIRTAEGETREILNRGIRVLKGKKCQCMIGSILELTDVQSIEAQISLESLQKEHGRASLSVRLQEEERIRIGHELHDNIAQLLTTSQLLLDLLEPSPQQKPLKKRCRQRLTEALEEIRNLSNALSVPLLRHSGLLPAIQDLIRDLEMATPLQVAFFNGVQAIEEFDETLKVALFRILQEQCKNIVRHARAHVVRIALKQGNGLLELEITDDGVGFDPGKVKRGVGLFSLFERVQMLDGNIKLDSAPEKGTRLLAIFPIVDDL